MKLRLLVLLFIISGLMAACVGTQEPEPSATVSPPTATTAPEPAATPADTPAPPPEPTAEPQEEEGDSDEGDSNEGDGEEAKTDRKSPAESPLDGPASPLAGPASPLAVPVPTSVPIVQFGLDRPIKPGDEEVSGFGPPNLPIVIIDITGGGDRLAEGVTDEDGKFTVELSRALISERRIGLTIGDLSESELAYEDFEDRGFYGPDAMMVPRIGVFYDTRMVFE